MADIGFSGIPITNRIRADQPVASAMGISGTAARLKRRRSAKSTRNTAARPARIVSARRHPDESLPFDSAASTGRPATSAVTPGGGFNWERMSSTIAFWVSSPWRWMPNARFAVARSEEITAWEK